MPALANPVWEAFAHEYRVDFSGTDAYLRACQGSCNRRAASVTATRLLQRPEVRDRIQELMVPVLQDCEVTVERIITESARIGFAHLTDVVEWNANGELRVKCASKDLPADVSAAIASVQEIPLKGGGKALKVKMHPKQPSLDLLARYKDMFPRANRGTPEEPLEIIIRKE